MLDLSRAQYHTGYNAYKNDNVYTGTYSITGSTNAGTNTRTFQVTLREIPDLLEIAFNAPTDTVFSSDPRPSNGWFKNGVAWVRGDNAGAGYTNYPTGWIPYTSINGNVLTVTLINVQQFTPSLTLTPTDLLYRITDYSIF